MAFDLTKLMKGIENASVIFEGGVSIYSSISSMIDSYQKNRYEPSRSLEEERRIRNLKKSNERYNMVSMSELEQICNIPNRLNCSYDSGIQQPYTPVHTQPSCIPTQMPVQYAQVPVMQSSCTPAYSYPQPYCPQTQVPVQYAQAPVVQPGQITIQQTAVGQTITMNTNDFIAAIAQAVVIGLKNQTEVDNRIKLYQLRV